MDMTEIISAARGEKPVDALFTNGHVAVESQDCFLIVPWIAQNIVVIDAKIEVRALAREECIVPAVPVQEDTAAGNFRRQIGRVLGRNRDVEIGENGSGYVPRSETNGEIWCNPVG